MIPRPIAVRPSSMRRGRGGTAGSRNWGITAPKKRSTFGLLSATSSPCRRKPPRGTGARAMPAGVVAERRSRTPSQARYAAPASRSQSSHQLIRAATEARPTLTRIRMRAMPICVPT
jgi:hypothetical protein